MFLFFLSTSYFFISLIMLYSTKFPFSTPSELYTFFANPIHLFVLLNAFLALLTELSCIFIKIMALHVSHDDLKQIWLTALNKIYFNLFLVYIMIGVADIFEFMVWFVILVSVMFIVTINILISANVETLNIYLENNLAKQIKYFLILFFAGSLNLCVIVGSFRLFAASSGFLLYFLLFYDYWKNLWISLSTLVSLLVNIASRNAPGPTVELRIQGLFYYRHISYVLVSVGDLAYWSLLVYTKGAGNILFNAIMAFKYYRSLRIIYDSVKNIYRFRDLNQKISAGFLDATAEEIQRAEICVICCETLREGKKLMCGHIFHIGCIINWLKYKNLCPICRSSIHIRETSSRRRLFIGNSFINASFEQRRSDTVFRLNTPRIGFLVPSINFEFHQVFSRRPVSARSLASNLRRRVLETALNTVSEELSDIISRRQALSSAASEALLPPVPGPQIQLLETAVGGNAETRPLETEST